MEPTYYIKGRTPPHVYKHHPYTARKDDEGKMIWEIKKISIPYAFDYQAGNYIFPRWRTR